MSKNYSTLRIEDFQYSENLNQYYLKKFLEDYNINDKNLGGYTLLNYVISIANKLPSNKVKEFISLLIANDAFLNTSNNDGNTPLHYCIMIIDTNLRNNIIKKILKNDIEIDFKNCKGETALYFAVVNNHIPEINSSIKLLLDNKADPYIIIHNKIIYNQMSKQLKHYYKNYCGESDVDKYEKIHNHLYNKIFELEDKIKSLEQEICKIKRPYLLKD